jgi:HSP20 family protein
MFNQNNKEVIMSIIRRNDMFPSMLGLFDDFFARDLAGWGLNNNSSTNTTIPAVNIRETNDNFEVEMAAPGMTKDDFKIELDGNMLTITSEKENRHEEKEGEKYTKREFSYQAFQRSFQLPKDVVDEDKIEAKYENGVLHLVIPKKEEAKQRPPRMIQIS